MRAYYNENHPHAAAWLRNLVAAGLIPAGDVDDRSILDVSADDLVGYRQCHFFAGIGGWPYALILAGWPADREVWTGSCPCQPLSSAGQRRAHADERHLWPAFYRLIAEHMPATVFGEQVASKDGREWLAGIRADLAALGFAVGAADLCAAGVGAPHIRQRLFWAADAPRERREGRLRGRPHTGREDQHRYAGRNGATGGLGNAGDTVGRPLSLDRQDGRHGQDAGREETYSEPGASGEVRRLGDADSEPRKLEPGEFPATQAREHGARQPVDGPQPVGLEHAGASLGAWATAVWLTCLDGKARRIEPGSFPLAHGVPARVGRLRGYGNAIVPQVAAEFIRAVIESL